MIELLVTLFLILVLLWFIYVYFKYPKKVKKHTNLIQIIMLHLTFTSIVFTIIYATKQINETRKIEEDRRRIAIDSLVKELEYNKLLVNTYIQHTEVGVNVKGEGVITTEWNQPQTKAYEINLTTACRGNLAVSSAVMFLYLNLDACKTIISYIHQLLANNFNLSSEREQLLVNEIKKNNGQLYDISKKIQPLIDELITKLNGMK